jgi:hypothetical protein
MDIKKRLLPIEIARAMSESDYLDRMQLLARDALAEIERLENQEHAVAKLMVEYFQKIEESHQSVIDGLRDVLQLPPAG